MDNDRRATMAQHTRQFVLKRIAECIGQLMGPVDEGDLIEIARSTEEANFLLATHLDDYIRKSTLKSLLLESGLATSLYGAEDTGGDQAATTASQILRVQQQWLAQQ